jgi:predicted Zn-dependent protease
MLESTTPEIRAFDEAFARGDVAEAQQVAARLRSHAPDSLVTRVVDARLEAVLGDPKSALKRLEKLVRKNPKSALPRAYYGSLLVGLGQPLKAISQLKMALKNEAGDVPAAHHAMGVALFVARRFEESISHLEVAERGLPESASTSFYLGQSHEAAGRAAEAARAYGRCCDIEPRYIDAWAGLVRLKAVAGDLDAASEAIDEGLARNPGDPTLMRLRVQVSFDRGDGAAAKEALCAIDPEQRSVEDWCNLGVLALHAGDWSEAERYAAAGVETEHHAWWPRHLLALALEGSGASREAVIAAYERALDRGDPRGESGTRLGFVLLTGEEEEQDAEKAIAVLELAAERNGGAPGTLLNLAIASENTGDVVRAQNLAAAAADHPEVKDSERAQAQRILEALSS